MPAREGKVPHLRDLWVESVAGNTLAGVLSRRAEALRPKTTLRLTAVSTVHDHAKRPPPGRFRSSLLFVKRARKVGRRTANFASGLPLPSSRPQGW
jgi:hypothetical protein